MSLERVKRLGSWILLWYVCIAAGVCRGQEKIAISELLDLKTRARALQEFVLRTDRNAEIFGWKDLAQFAKEHDDIGVLASADRREKKKRYVVTWKKASRLDEDLGLPGEKYSKENFDRLFPPLGSGEFILPGELGFSVFEEDGSLVELEGAPNSELKGFVTDLNGEGEIEVMEAAESGSVRYVMVRQLTGPQPLFAVAYEWGDLKARGKAWGYAIRKGEDGNYDMLFGQRERDTITPEVVFQWDARWKTWTCENAGDHLRVLGLKNVWDEIIKLGGETSVKIPLMGGPRLSIEPDNPNPSVEEPWKLPEMPPLNPYRHESLAKLGNAELLAWDGSGTLCRGREEERYEGGVASRFLERRSESCRA